MAKVLVIEDELINQHILKQSLQQQGYEVEVASNGETGLAIAESFLPNLIICDWVMPQMSGLDVCRSAKANAALSSAFFILLTAKTKVQDRIEGLDSGADDFLNKPVDSGELQARVRSGLRIYESQLALRQLAEALQKKQSQLQSELSQAANYVTSLLPQPIAGKVSVNSSFFPSSQLGGDCFDFYWLDEDHLMLYLLDVSGHGVGAALPSVSMQQLLRSRSLPSTNFTDPSNVLTGLNQAFQMSEQNPRFFSIWYGVYECSTRSLTYASAGHPPAVLIAPTGKTQTIGQTGQIPIGMFADSEYAANQINIVPGSHLYLFSDGLYEIQQANGSLWNHKGLVQLLDQQHQIHSKVSLAAIIKTIRGMQQNLSFEDDCSIVQACF